MKPNHSRIWKRVIFTLMIIALSQSIMAVNLLVGGITDPIAAKGKYLPIADQNSHKAWKHESQNYYIYYKVWSSIGYWNIDIDLDDDDVLFFSNDNPAEDSPTKVTEWITSLGSGFANVIEEGGPIAPEINLRGNSIIISDNAVDASFNNFTKFGSADISTGTIDRTFTIENIGTATLSLSELTIISTNASDFTIKTAPATTIAADASTTFTITFNPSALGDRIATINIANNDADENPYNFDIQGYGFSPKDLIISGITNPSSANGNYVFMGTIFGFEYWKHATQEFYLFNDESINSRYWNIDQDTDDTNDNYLYWNVSDTGSPVGLSSWTANTTGSITGFPVINDAIPIPNIILKGNEKTILSNDFSPAFTDSTNFGSVDVSSGTKTRIFTIQNTGGANLTLSGTSPFVTIGGTNAEDFSITAAPPSDIAANSSTTFIVTFNPSVTGTRSAILSISSNDPDQSIYTFAIQGDGYIPQKLNVSGITTPSAANGVYTHMGIKNEFQYWKHSTENYYIYNDIFGNVRYWNIDSDDATSYFYSNDGGENASPVNVSSWHIETVEGIEVEGTPLIEYYEPEIDVQGNSNSILDGSTTTSGSNFTDFGSSNISSGTVIQTFSILNTGNAPLALTGNPKIAIFGTNASDFSVTQLPTSPVAATAGTTTFQITFDPSSSGVRTATVSIASDDSNENPYDFSIIGVGLTPPTATSNAATSITSYSATLNGLVNANNESAVVTFEYGLTNSYGTTVTAAQSPVTGTSETTVSATISNLTSITTYHFRVKAESSAGATIGLDKTFVTTMGTNVDKVINESIIIYPNPTTDGFYVNEGVTEKSLDIYDLTGRILFTQQVINKTYINISTLSFGVYIVKVNNKSVKLIKTR